jgi:DNA-binding response OmpR family regulator
MLLRVTREQGPVTGVMRMSAGSARSGKVHVLLVEDDETVSTMYRLRLEMDGFRVVVASDGEAGLRLARELRPDLLVLDYGLPRLGGAALLRALRADEQTRDQPVIVLSAYDDARRVAEGSELGVLHWLVKSRITPGELSAVVGSLVELELGRAQAGRCGRSSSARRAVRNVSRCTTRWSARSSSSCTSKTPSSAPCSLVAAGKRCRASGTSSNMALVVSRRATTSGSG